MRILFYLPVVTPWWFVNRIAPLLRALHDQAELHLMVAPLWSSTGITSEDAACIADLPDISWHVVDADDPALFRLNGAGVPGVVERVREIGPDLTLARSADFATPAAFPGVVRYIMEGATPPFLSQPVLPQMIEERPFRLGAMPPGSDAVAARCEQAFADIYEAESGILTPALRHDWRSLLGLPANRPILAVPLQYEHEEDFFRRSSAFARGIDLLHHLLDTIDEQIFLAITDHPLNRKFVDRSDIHDVITSNAERAALCSFDGHPMGATGILAAHADAMLIEQSKSWMLAAYCGTPMVLIGNSIAAAWLNATSPAETSLATWPAEGLPRPDPASARRWFSWHLGARTYDPASMTLDRLLAQVRGDVGPDIIDSNAALLRSTLRKAA